MSTHAGPGTPGHRESKKARTRAEILANAIALFRRDGVQAARSNEIAAGSGVSPATLFNYFPTRSDLASAWVRGELRDVLDRSFVGSGAERGLRSALRLACRSLAERSLDEPERRLEAWRFVRRARAAREIGRDAGGSPLEKALAREQGRGRIRSDVAAAGLADLLADALEGGLIEGLETLAKTSPSAAADLAGPLRDRVDLVLDGARKRNERVAAPGAAPGAGSAGPP